jgi:hypothetical protein
MTFVKRDGGSEVKSPQIASCDPSLSSTYPTPPFHRGFGEEALCLSVQTIGVRLVVGECSRLWFVVETTERRRFSRITGGFVKSLELLPAKNEEFQNKSDPQRFYSALQKGSRPG